MINRKKQSYRIILNLLICAFLVARANSVSAEISVFSAASDSTGNNILIRAKTGKAKVYKGEPVSVSYILYYRVPVIDPQNEINVKFDDCEVEEFPVTGMPFNDKINGQGYQAVLLKNLLIIPQQTGSLKIPAVNQNFKMNAPPDPDDFFGVERIISTKVSSQTLNLPVLPLPLKKDSAAFTGAIGKFSFESAYTPDTKHPNLLTFTLKVSGTGNLKGVAFTSPVLPSGTEIFNESSSGKHTLGKNELKAEHLYTYQVMANYRGDYTLPAISFLYFDPDKGEYLKHQIAAFEWQVKEGPLPPLVASEQKQHSETSLPLYSRTSLKPRGTDYFFAETPLSLLMLLASGLCFMVGFLVAEKVRRREQDPGKYRFRKAEKKAIKQINKLKSQITTQDQESFSRNLVEVFKEYLAAKSYRLTNDINLESLSGLLSGNNIPEQRMLETIKFINTQYKLRFSGIKPQHDERQKHLQLVEQLIKDLEPSFNGKVTA